MSNFADIVILHATNIKPKVELESSIYAPNDHVYILNQNQDKIQFGKSLFAAEKERNEWIRKYENVLSGLNYWKDRALSK